MPSGTLARKMIVHSDNAAADTRWCDISYGTGMAKYSGQIGLDNSQRRDVLG